MLTSIFRRLTHSIRHLLAGQANPSASRSDLEAMRECIAAVLESEAESTDLNGDEPAVFSPVPIRSIASREPTQRRAA